MYYLFVGWPSLLNNGALSIYLMRIVSAAASAALLAMALALALAFGEGGLLVAGVVLAIPPSLIYLSSVVEPNGFEAAAAICLWTALLLLGRRQRAGLPVPNVIVNAATIGGIALELTRQLSPLWLVVALGVGEALAWSF